MRHIDRRLIIGGTSTEKGRYPYFVSVGPFCGGSLIAPDVVLSAGHCVPHGNPSKLDIRIGTESLETNQQQQVDFETFPISQAFRHPRYERLGEDEFRFDFALFFLNGTSSHTPISINQDPDVPLPNTTVVAMGFGNMKREEESRSSVLRQVSLTTISNHECRSAGAGKKRSYENRVHVDHQCTTGGPHNERDACAYDSGGPVVIQKTDADDSKDLLVGLVSWGEGCANPIYPAVNSRVSSASQWVEEMVCSTSISPPEGFCNLTLIEQVVQDGPLRGEGSGRAIWIVTLVVAFGVWSLRSYRRRQNHVRYDPVN